MDRIIPNKRGAEQRRSFVSVVGFPADVLIHVWRKYREDWRISRISLLDIAWTCAWLRCHLPLPAMSELLRTTRETLRRRVNTTILAANGFLHEARYYNP